MIRSEREKFEFLRSLIIEISILVTKPNLITYKIIQRKQNLKYQFNHLVEARESSGNKI